MTDFIRVYFDLETTGLSIWNDHIVQIAATVCVDSECKGVFETNVKSTKPMQKTASQVTGIYDKDLVDAPSSEEALVKFFNWMNEMSDLYHKPIALVAYNGLRFDFPLLYSELTRENLTCLWKDSKITRLVDPLVWAKEHLDSTILVRRATGACSYALNDVYTALFERQIINAHQALADAQALQDIVCHDAFGEIGWSGATNYNMLQCDYRSKYVKEKYKYTCKKKPTRTVRSLTGMNKKHTLLSSNKNQLIAIPLRKKRSPSPQ